MASSLKIGSPQSIRHVADSKAGALYDATVASMQRLLDNRGGAGQPSGRAGPFSTYLRAVLFGEHPSSQLPREKVRELQSLVRTLDELSSGKVKVVADILAQRFAALELGTNGRGDLATEVDLTALEDQPLTSAAEMDMVRKGSAAKLKALDR